MKTLGEAIEFARSHDMTVSVGEVEVRVAYPCGDEETFLVDDPDAPRKIVEMTCRML
jgi:hypothetical protein